MRITPRHIGAIVLGLAVLGTPDSMPLASILDSRHNLSISGPGPVKSTTEGEVCVFCHAPHNTRRDTPYLWNRLATTTNYIPYESSTLHATVGQPTGASKLCLSCHDGTVAMGALLNRPAEVPFEGGVRFIPEGRGKLGSDLSDDHPVSFPYDSALAASNPELTDPLNLPTEVRLDGNGELQCTACHDPHDDLFGKFLVMSNQYSALCTSCHAVDGWPLGGHALSNAQWNSTGADPWPNSTYESVAENACGSCHVSHAAGGHERLLNYAIEEDNCLVCHTGNVATKDIGDELTKVYGHFVQNYAGVHDPAEDFSQSGVPTHVECADCHNPHQSNATPSLGAPFVSGATKGVSGIDASGLAVSDSQYEYEICYKCHGDNNVSTSLSISRQIPQLNTRLEFDAANPSFHPVTAVGVNPNVPSLLPPLTTSSRTSCTDCHNNDDSFGPRGPHGSSQPYLLAGDYLTADNTTESPGAYELCYGCHSRASILADQSFSTHYLHIVTSNTPCSACHDPHGVSSSQGNAVNNAHLINFDLNIVQPDSMGRLYYEDTGVYSGQCYLSCHGREHAPLP
ncbi:MAG: cytochrome c3 family protein [Steroidobacteraceae bacterium]